MTEPTRQLPGVKGQFILCSDCRPTKADGSSFGSATYVSMFRASDHTGDYKTIEEVGPHEYWRPVLKNDPRPFTLPAAPAPGQAAVGARLFDKLTGNADGSLLWAVADDGTAWERDRAGSCTWEQFPPLPPRDA